MGQGKGADQHEHRNRDNHGAHTRIDFSRDLAFRVVEILAVALEGVVARLWCRVLVLRGHALHPIWTGCGAGAPIFGSPRPTPMGGVLGVMPFSNESPARVRRCVSTPSSATR